MKIGHLKTGEKSSLEFFQVKCTIYNIKWICCILYNVDSLCRIICQRQSAIKVFPLVQRSAKYNVTTPAPLRYSQTSSLVTITSYDQDLETR